MSSSPSLERDSLILVHAPVGRDASLLSDLLERARLPSQVCLSVEQLCREIERGVGALFIAEEALVDGAITSLAAVLKVQGPWSDLPLIVLTVGGEPTLRSRERLSQLEPLGGLTLLERPLRSDTIISAARSALRARAKQYEIRRRDAELQLVTDNVPVLISYIDRQQVFRRVNRTYSDWFGKHPEEIVGLTIREVSGEPHYSVAQPYISRALSGERVSFESQLVDKDKQLRMISVSYAPDIAQDGDVRGLITLVQDVTERKRAERRSAFLVALDDAIRPLADPAEITQAAARLLGEHLDVSRCAYADVEEDEDTFNLSGDFNRGVPSIVGRYTFQQFGRECLRLMREGKPYVVEDTESDIRTADVRDSYRNTLIRSVICVSLRKQGRFVAAMAVHQTSPRTWRADEIDTVQQVASRCWESIERTRVMREMKASEEQFRTLANSIPNLAWMAYEDGHVFWYNQRWYSYTGTTEKDMEGWGWKSIHDPAILPDVIARWRASIATGTVFEMTFPLRGADGSFRLFLTRVEPVKDSHGRVVRWFGTNTDITSQQEAEQRLRAAVLGSPFPIMLHAEDGAVLALSRSWSELTGYTPQDLPTHRDWISLAFSNAGESGHAGAYTSCSSPHGEIGEVVIRTRSGEERIWDYHVVPLGALPDGRKLQMSAAVDVTERSRAEETLREREQELRIALETAGLGSWRLDLKTHELTCSNRCYENFSVPTNESFTYERLLSLIHPADLPHMLEAMEGSIRNGVDYNAEYRITRGDGTLGWIVASGRPIYGNDGLPGHMIGVTLDVSERKLAEEALKRSNEDLTRANQELEEFAYVSSHDLQEPLRMVNSYSQLLLRRLGPQADQELQKFTDYIRTGVRRMEALIKDLLTYSRATHTEENTFEGQADLSAALAEALSRVDTRIQESGAEVTSEPLPVVLGDQGQLSHVFQNLLSNALKYRKPDEPPRIHVGAERQNGHCVVSISDNGIGFDPKQSQRIFGLFKRLHREEEYPGTGLGLAICKRIVERYQGRMWADSKEGVGSTFYIALPEIRDE